MCERLVNSVLGDEGFLCGTNPTLTTLKAQPEPHLDHIYQIICVY